MTFFDMLDGYLTKKQLDPSISFLNLNFTDTTVISGKKDSGKSYFANILMKTISRFVLWDARYERVKHNSPIKSKKAILITDETIKLTSKVEDIGKYDKVIFHPIVHDQKEVMQVFDLVCKKVRQSGNYVFIVEEADSVIPFGRIMDSGIFELCQGNIHNNCGLIFITRRLQRLNVDAVRLADNLFIFQYSTKDKEYLESFGIEDLKPLKKREFYFYTEGKDLEFMTTEDK